MNEDELLVKVGQAFDEVFKGRLTFRSDLDRDTVSQWDSLKHVELMIALERLFGLRFDGADITEMVSVRAIQQVISDRVNRP